VVIVAKLPSSHALLQLETKKTKKQAPWIFSCKCQTLEPLPTPKSFIS